MNFQIIFAKNKILLAVAFLMAVAVFAYNTLPSQYWAFLVHNESPTKNHKSPTDMNFDYDAAWKEIDSLEQNGLPKTALEKTEALLEIARKENASAQVVKALIFRGKYQSQLEEEGLAKAINRLQEEAAKADYSVKPILQSMLAELYTNYLDQNLYRFQNRTETVDFKPEDFKTWSIAQLTEKSAELYRASLIDSRLKTTDIGDFKILLTEGKNDEGLRPTLFDFLAHRAIDYFMNERSYVTQPAYKFYIDDARAFAPAAQFVDWKIETRDSASQKLQTLLLLQDLLRFRLSEKRLKSPSLLDADLKRLEFVYDNTVIEVKDEAYLAALETLRNQYGGTDQEAEVLYYLARYYHGGSHDFRPLPFGIQAKEDKKWFAKKALEYCDKAIESYPNSYGASHCASIKRQVVGKSLSVHAELVNLPNKPILLKIDYKNVKTAWVKAVKLSPQQKAEFRELYRDQNGKSDALDYINKLPVAKKSQVSLGDDGDFNQHSTEAIFDELPLGIYALVIAENGQFDIGDVATFATITNISNIGYWVRENGRQEKLAFVMDRVSGKPIKGAKVEVWNMNYEANVRKYEWKKVENLTTDSDGKIELNKLLNNRNSQYKLVISNGNDVLDTDESFNAGYDNYYGQNDYERTFFFLDRAIYRPGQTVFFKGLAVKFDDNRIPKIIKNKEVTVQFLDANYQPVASLKLRTNDFGTFSGQFTAPRTGLTGQMQIQSNIGGQSQYFRVEEYKRPKFELQFEPIAGSYRINDEVTVQGKALAYAGNNIDGAMVKYRVVREARFPWLPWWYAKWFPQNSESMEITNGELKTDEEGKFEVKFKALPDRAIPTEQKPEFSYTVYVDITDITGETQSKERTVNVGYVSLRVDIWHMFQSIENQCFDFQTFSEVQLQINNLNGVKENANGTLKLEKLNAPKVAYIERYWESSDQRTMDEAAFKKAFPNLAFSNENQPQNWPIEKSIFVEKFDNKDTSIFKLPNEKLEAGWYVMTLSTQDKFGEKIEVKKYFSGYDLSEKSFPMPSLGWHKKEKKQSSSYSDYASYAPGEDAGLWFGSSEGPLNVLLEIEKNNEIVCRKWLSIKELETEFFNIKESHRGGVDYRYSYTLNNRSFNQGGTINVGWDKYLNISYGTFRDKLLPGEKEEWILKISGSGKDKYAAEMVAAMYDASLDALAPNYWGLDMSELWPSNYCYTRFESKGFGVTSGYWLFPPTASSFQNPQERQYKSLNWFNWYMYENYGRRMYKTMARVGGIMEDAMMEAAPAPAMAADEGADLNVRGSRADATNYFIDGVRVSGNLPPKQAIQEIGGAAPTTDLSQVKVRTNLSETVFFYPHLMTDAEGNVVIKFTMNEALTKWKFLGLATTQDLQIGTTSKEIVTQKDLMVVPNPPRFFREYDEIEFTAKVVNLSKEVLNGEYKLELKNALTGDDVFPLNGTNPAMNLLLAPQRLTDLKPGESRRLAWRFKVPDVADVPVIEHTVIVTAGNFSDAERSAAPVLSNRMLVTETLPLPVRGGQTKNFVLNSLKTNNSTTLRHQGMTLEFTQNPAWYAVQALPYLMEYPYECNEQIFSRYYANSLATSVANSHPKIKTVFDRWRNYEPDALKSNLSKNQELKTALLEETPWVLAAQSEEQQKQNIALLFDLNRMAYEQEVAIKKLQERQLSNGGWGWFPGDRDNWYITQYIVEGLGHLQRLGVQDVTSNPTTAQMVETAVRYCDARMVEEYEQLERMVKAGKAKWEDDHLGYMAIHYLYARSFFLENNSAQANSGNNFKTKMPLTLDENAAKVHNYYIGQAEKFWLNKGMYSEGMLALSMDRSGKSVTAQKIVKSLKERSLNNDELGMYWKYPTGWWWYQAPIETQALLIEVFNDVAADAKSVDDLKVWLLKNKQTTHWKTTKATAAAVYALLTSGDNWLLEDQPVVINFGDKNAPNAAARSAAIAQAQKGAEAGTGYFKHRFDGRDVTNDMANVTVTNPNKVVAWGALYWQYFEQLDKIKTFEETPLTIKKQLFLVKNSDRGEVLTPIAEQQKLKVGDKVKVRIELRVDRDMEYVHMKDMRASSFEPMNVLSSYKYQGGLGYYESTRDAATNFFFSWLPKGTHVFEYPLRVTYNGDFSNGITTIQSMYAPEFTSHSAGIRIEVE